MYRTKNTIIASVLLSLFFILECFGQDSPPQIEIVGNQEYCADAPIPIVTSAEIADSDVGDNTLDNVFIQISEGYQINQDVLSLSGNNPNVTASWSPAQGRLTLIGPASFTDFEDAIENVVFETTQTEFTEDKSVSINLSSANYLPSTGHYYVYVPDLGITWVQAEAAAENQVLFGIQGYLATLTSAEESQLAGEQSPGTGWIGATDAEQENVWEWVTGPEAGTVFWIGEINGTPQNGEFSFWNTGEPNNFNGDEDYAHITDPSIGNIGSWNDLPNAGDTDPNSPYYPKGYFVEFGGMPGDPEINLSASTSIITPKLTVSNSSACGNFSTELSVTSNTPRVLWYDSENSTTVINEGLTYDVTLSETTTFWVQPLFNGCNTGTRFDLTVNVFPLPEAVDLNIIQCEDEMQDGLGAFDLSDYVDDVAGGQTSNREVNFYEDVGLSVIIDDNIYNSISNPQTIYAEVIATDNGCINTSQIVLQTNTATSNSAFLESCDNQAETGLISFTLSDADDQILNGLVGDFEVSYYRSFQDALFEDSQLSNNFTNTVPYGQTIYARVENDGACYTIGELDLIVIELPELEPDAEVFYCLNNFPEPISISGGVLNDVPNNYYYNWSTGETTIAIEVNEPGVYTVKVTPVNGCPKTRSITVLASNIATVENVSVTDLVDDNSISLEVSGEGDYEFSLDSEFGPWQTSNTFDNLSAGIYTVFIRDAKNNCGILSKEVSVVGYPKFFTPNGDGNNDFWKLSGVSEQFQPNTKVFIYDRYGKLLYSLDNFDQRWDGTFNGRQLPVSDYWFYATLEDGRDFRGNFTLKR